MKNVNYLSCETSLAYTFGNITTFIMNKLMDSFPKGTFKTTHIHSKIAHQQLKNSGDFLKKSKPMLIIRPRIDYDSQDDVFLANTLIMQKQTDIYSSYGDSNLQDFMYDADRKLALKFQLNRIVVAFDVVMIFNTLIQQIEKRSYFENKWNVTNAGNDICTCLENYIPRAMIESISKVSGIPMYDDNGNVKRFLDYLNSISLYPITYKLKGSKNADEFFRYYPAKIDTVVQNLSSSEGESIGQSTGNYQVTFTLRCEFNTAGSLFLFSENINKIRKLNIDTSDSIVPIFTDVILENDYNLKDGWNIYKTPSVRLDDTFDQVSFTEILNESLKTCIDYHLEHGIPIERFMIIRVRAQGRELDHKFWEVDYKKKNIYFNHCPINLTYKIVMIINTQYINELIKSIYKLE